MTMTLAMAIEPYFHLSDRSAGLFARPTMYSRRGAFRCPGTCVVYADDIEAGEYGWRECWGVKFKWTSEHLTPQDLEPLIHTYDTTATEAAERLDEISPPPFKNQPPNNEDKPPQTEKKITRDLYELLPIHAANDEKVNRLWTEINTVPDWVNWEQLERGQKVFYRYGAPIITALTFLSLLGGMASGRTVQTLDRTGGFGVDVVRRRLLETTQHTLNVTRDLDSIKPGGEGFEDSVRVRLLHAAVRRRIMGMAKSKPKYYKIRKFGVPINDLDCIGTINTFSAALIWMGLPRQGIWLREQEIVDYLALWRYIAYLMGTPHDWMSTPASARRMMESLLVAEIKPSKASANLANNIITGLQNQPPMYASREFMCAQTYWLNGHALSKELEIDKPSWFYFALVLGQCILFMIVSYVDRNIGDLDERNINVVRRGLYKILLRDKSKGGLGYETKFNFKYIPSFDRKSTERGAARTGTQNKMGRVEHTALITLLITAALAGAFVWYGGKAVWWVILNSQDSTSVLLDIVRCGAFLVSGFD
ncbi:hypothetical protein F5Y04DRAFT_268786 [Hypomontagnella monticulosa]|nr:hypothetical protein F5Y04DRAFT_268786 [Hypomontagnella monticulosa]